MPVSTIIANTMIIAFQRPFEDKIQAYEGQYLQEKTEEMGP
jgi:hypothetical protein